MDTYTDIIENKKRKVENTGFEVSRDDLNPLLKDFQKHCVQWALRKGKAALFANTGQGKTFMQLEWAKHVHSHTGVPVLILAPLAVIRQTINEGNKFGIPVSDDANGPGICIANYEQLHNIDCTRFAGVVLDESSILKNFTGATKKAIIESFKLTPYKLACTATPSPNDLNEIGNHSEFLDVLDSQDMRAKWFVRDEGMNNYRLKGHAKDDFYAWMRGWSMMFRNPGDLGFTEEGYDLPELLYHEIVIKTKSRGNGTLFNEKSVNATGFNAELKATMDERLEKAASIVNASTGQFLVWVKHNEEGKRLKEMIPGSVEVSGSDKPEVKQRNLIAFANSEFRVLITKTDIASMGLNLQSCHQQIFVALDFSFESLYQAVRRSYRFGQKNNVHIYIISTDTMDNVLKIVKRKEQQFLDMQLAISEGMNSKQYGLLNEYQFEEYKTPEMWLMHGDSCIEIDRVPDNSVDLIVFSPPFSSLFTYSNYIHDMGNNESHEDFFKQYSWLLKKLYAKLKPGRIMVCHTKDLGIYKNSSGYTGMYDFTDDHTRAVIKAVGDEKTGFKLHSKVTIWCDPVLEMQRTKTQRLLYKTLTSNSALTGIGMCEYLRAFKKWDGTDESNWEPVSHLTKQNTPLELWQKWASGVWMDIKRTDVLNNAEGTALGDEKHIAPLQLEVIHRCVNLWSNPGDTVLTPFLGIGSEAYVAINNNRKAIGIELKDSYYQTAIKNCNKAISLKAQGSLFDTGLYTLRQTKKA